MSQKYFVTCYNGNFSILLLFSKLCVRTYMSLWKFIYVHFVCEYYFYTSILLLDIWKLALLCKSRSREITALRLVAPTSFTFRRQSHRDSATIDRTANSVFQLALFRTIWKGISRQLVGAELIQWRTRLVTSRKWRGAERQPVGNLHFFRSSFFYFLINILFVRLTEDRTHPFEIHFLCRVFISKLRVLPFPFSWSIIPDHNGPVLFARPNVSRNVSVKWRTRSRRRLCVIFDITPMLHEEFPVNFFTVMCVLPRSNKSTSARQWGSASFQSES